MHSLTHILYNYFTAHYAACTLSLKNLIRSPLGSLITLCAISLSLTLPIVSLIALDNITTLTQNWNKGTSLTLYLQKNTTQEQAQALLNTLLATEEIKSGSYLSPDQALTEFKSWSHLDEAIALLPDNPLPGVITLHPQPAYESPEALGQLAQNLKQFAQVDHLSFDREGSTKLKAILQLAELLFFILMGLIGVGNSVVIANTVRLALETHKEELKILSLIGATPAFIRRPFLYRGLWYGLLGALLSYVFVVLIIHPLSAPLQKIAALYGDHFILKTGDFTTFSIILLISTCLGWIGAWMALMLYNKSK